MSGTHKWVGLQVKHWECKQAREASVSGPTAAPLVKKGTVHNPDKGKQPAQANHY